LLTLTTACISTHAELARWVQNIPSPSQLEAVFLRAVTLPSGAIEIRRPPKETRVELSKLIAARPSQADLYALRAREDELQLDFTAAENDWKKAAQPLDLADYYHRRIRPKEEIAALEAIGNGRANTAWRRRMPRRPWQGGGTPWAQTIRTRWTRRPACHWFICRRESSSRAKRSRVRPRSSIR
jgi:hypothetical protein